MYIFPGRLIRAALRRIQTYGRKTVIHTITKENLKSSKSLSWNVAREWLDERNAGTIRETCQLMEK